MFDNLALGLSVALTPTNLLVGLVGAAVGTAIGVLPGLGPVATISLLIPLTYYLEPTSAIIMLSGIYLGAMYGGSITSILVNVPGEAASVVTCIDGHQMAKRGRAGAALGISAFGSFFGGITAALGLALFAPLVPQLAKNFGPPEYAMLVLAGMLLITQIGTRGRMQALLMVCVGLLLSTVGTDPISGDKRFNLGLDFLEDGIGIIPLAIGLFGVAELLALAANREATGTAIKTSLKLKDLLPNRGEWKRAIPAIFRGSIAGFFFGLLPGGGMTLVSFSAYALEKKMSRHPKEFGHGAIEGVAGPETANNAGSQSAFAPMLTLGLPSNATMGVLMGALMVHGVAVGPQLIVTHPSVFWGVIASMLVANVILLILNVPLISIFVRLLQVPPSILIPGIVLLVVVGAYTADNRFEDVMLTIAFGILGFWLRRKGVDPSPMVLAYVLGNIFERSFRQALILGDGPGVFLDRPVSLTLLLIAATLLIYPMVAPRIPFKRLRAAE